MTAICPSIYPRVRTGPFCTVLIPMVELWLPGQVNLRFAFRRGNKPDPVASTLCFILRAENPEVVKPMA